MEKNLINTTNQTETNVLDSLFAEMLLDRALFDFRKTKIEEKIDQSLRERNKEEFLRLTGELKNTLL